MRTECFYPRNKAAGAWSWPPPSSVELYLQSAIRLHGVVLSYSQGQLYRYLYWMELVQDMFQWGTSLWSTELLISWHWTLEYGHSVWRNERKSRSDSPLKTVSLFILQLLWHIRELMGAYFGSGPSRSCCSVSGAESHYRMKAETTPSASFRVIFWPYRPRNGWLTPSYLLCDMNIFWINWQTWKLGVTFMHLEAT